MGTCKTWGSYRAHRLGSLSQTGVMEACGCDDEEAGRSGESEVCGSMGSE